MKKLLFLLCLAAFHLHTQAQLTDNFSDGNFTSDPEWLGDNMNFIVNNSLELQLSDANATGTSTSQLFTAANTAGQTTWEFFVRQEFSPSANNHSKVYLKSNTPDLTGSLNGYFVKIGGESGTSDALELYKQTGTTQTLLLRGTEGALGGDPNSARVRVLRDASGLWDMQVDYTGGTDFDSEGMITDTDHEFGFYFGFNCRYTSTRAEAFFFDDIFIDPLWVDQEPPQLLTASPISATEIDLAFNEPLLSSSAETSSNYLLNGMPAIVSASLDGSDPTLVHLQLQEPLISLQSYEIEVLEIQDVAGNPAFSLTAEFEFIQAEQAEPGDIIISEIMADPNPPVGLPEAEYIELFNRSNKVIDAGSLAFSSGSTPGVLAPFLILPQSYVIICDDGQLENFSPFGEVVTMSSFPALTNTEDQLELSRSSDGLIVSEVAYTDDWYRDEVKKQGGYSLELINPELYCKGSENWRASNNPAGGSPGTQNSVFSETPDNTGPSVLGGLVISESEIYLLFDEDLDENIDLTTGFTFVPEVGEISEAGFINGNLRGVQLRISSPFFTDATDYVLSANPTITDCVGNPVTAQNSFSFTYFDTEPADQYDILINEIFADPTPSIGLPEAEYIELYNRSDKAINLADFSLMDLTGEVVLPNFVLLPDSYVIVYEKGTGSFSAFGDTLALNDFIGLGNEIDQVELLDPEGNIIHAVPYNITWYRDNNKNDGGWSLELINPDAPCEFSENWRATENENGGTPGFENSILSNTTDETVPDLVRVFPDDNKSLRLFLSEAVSIENGEMVSNYSIDGIDILAANVEAPLFNSVLLSFAQEMVPGEEYEVIIKNDFTDCVGNAIGVFNSAVFQLPEIAEPNDLVVNEILVNPETGGVDFVELFNISEKAINLAELFFGNRDEEERVVGVVQVFTDFLLLPGRFAVVTPSPTDIQNRYFVENPRAMIANPLPTYRDKEGTVVLFRPELLGALVIDEFAYQDSFHNALLDVKDGVSLERIDPFGPTQSRTNWHSAAEKVGFATPTYQNSQFKSNEISGTEIINIPSDIFSPDNDGNEDFLFINYKTEDPGFLANIKIFDAKGREIKSLINNELLANEGTFKWDGDTDDGTKARLGIYVVWIELFNPNGTVYHFKETCVVAGQLE